MKALVLARGRGTRMRAADPDAVLTSDQEGAARAGHKALMPVAGRPFLDFILGALADAGIDEVAAVIGAEHREAFRAYQTAGRFRRVRLDLVEQRQPKGTADAVWSAAAWLRDEPFLVVNGDNLYPVEALRTLAGLGAPALAVFDREDLVAFSNIPAARIASFAVAEVDESGDLIGIVEKPAAVTDGRAARPVLVSMNAWRFDSGVLRACRDAPISERGEYELPAAVSLAMRRGIRFRAVRAAGPVLDLSRQADVAAVSRRLAGVEPCP